MGILSRRQFGLAAAALPLAGLWRSAVRADAATLHVGDQRGSIRAILKGAGLLDNVPYPIDWAIFAVGAPLVEAMNAGAVDFGYVGDATTTFGLAAGAAIKTINTWHITGIGSVVLVPSDKSYKTIADLRGKRIGLVRGSPGHVLVAAALSKAGLPIDSVDLIFLSAADAKTALARGAIDAWSIWDPYAASAEIYDHMRILVTSAEVLPEIECGIATDSAIATKRPQLLDFMDRVRRAFDWSEVHREEYTKNFATETGLPYEVAALTTSRMHVTVDRQVTDEAIGIHQRVADVYFAAGVIARKLDVTQAYDRSFSLSA